MGWLDDITGGWGGDAARIAGAYGISREGEKSAREAGQLGYSQMNALGQKASDATQFKPFGVTSNLANVQVDPTGNLNVNLNAQQQAMQNQLMGQASGLFSQVGQDPAQAQAALYEQMRGVQRPDEQRQRLALEERMLSQGRTGLSSAAYGGSSPELLAQETAIQEAMARANLGARQQSQAEQLQAGQLGGYLQGFGYQPQQQALNMFGAGVPTAELVQRGQQRGAELQALAGQTGVESLMQGANMANLLEQQQLQGMLTSVFGQAPTMQEQILNQLLNKGSAALQDNNGLFGSILGALGGSNSSSSSPSFSAPSTGMDSWLGGSNFYDSIAPQSPVIPTNADGIDLSSYWTN